MAAVDAECSNRPKIASDLVVCVVEPTSAATRQRRGPKKVAAAVHLVSCGRRCSMSDIEHLAVRGVPGTSGLTRISSTLF